MEREKYLRGLNKEQIKLLEKYHELIEDPELFLGIRNGYCNIYYQCASMGKLCFAQREKKVTVEIHRKYLPETYADQLGDKPYVKFSSCEKREEFTIERFFELAKKDGAIRTVISAMHENGEKGCQQKADNKEKKKREKIYQQKLALDSAEKEAEWFCVDMEYVQAQEIDEKKQRSFGRFDLVAVKKHPDDKGKHPVALIELKAGNAAYPSAIYDEEVKNNIEGFCIDKYDRSLGSGLLGHMADFYRFETRYVDGEKVRRFDCLRKEIRNILANREALGIFVPDTLKKLDVDRLSEKPEFYFVTLCDNKEDMESCKKSLQNYMNSHKENKNASKYNVMDVFAKKVLEKPENKTKFRNYHFYFYDLGNRTDLKTGVGNILEMKKDSFTKLEWEEVFK